MIAVVAFVIGSKIRRNKSLKSTRKRDGEEHLEEGEICLQAGGWRRWFGVVRSGLQRRRILSEKKTFGSENPPPSRPYFIYLFIYCPKWPGVSHQFLRWSRSSPFRSLCNRRRTTKTMMNAAHERTIESDSKIPVNCRCAMGLVYCAPPGDILPLTSVQFDDTISRDVFKVSSGGRRRDITTEERNV